MKKKKKIITLLIILVVVICLILLLLNYLSKFESTNDAYITGNPIYLVSNVSGHISKDFIKNNEYIKKGKLLFIIDQTSYLLNIKNNINDIKISNSNLNILKWKFEISKSKLLNVAKTLKRSEKMYINKAISKENLDNVITKYNILKNSLYISNQQLKIAKYKLYSLKIELAHNKLLLSYTKIYAPQSGIITKSNLQIGSFIVKGNPFLSIVTNKKWVIANFKETQIRKLKIGQNVLIKIDAYPAIVFKGKISSIQNGTGAVFSLLPPENATGNFVKVVQRIPVKIEFLSNKNIAKYKLILGMSVVPKVILNSK